MKQLHDLIDLAIGYSISRADFRFSQYLDDRGVGEFVNHSSWAIVGETELVGELMLYACLVEYALGESISYEHIGVIRSRLFHPKTFSAILEREPLRFTTDLLETATPAATVNAFAGSLMSVLGHKELKKWFISALGTAVHAAAEICVAHFKSLEEAEKLPTLFPRPTARERTVARLGAVVRLLKPRKGSALQVSTDRRLPPSSSANFLAPPSALLSSPGDVAKLWITNAQHFTAGALSIARAEYEAIKATVSSPAGPTLGDVIRRGKGLFFRSPISPPPSPSRSRRSRAPSLSFATTRIPQ